MQADASVVAADADNDFAEADAGVFADVATSVSYTHLTLPTNREV